MSVLTYEELVSDLALKITENGNKAITGPVLNLYIQGIIESMSLKHIVADTAARNAITTKYAGMRVFTTGDSKTYILNNDLVTWKEAAFDAYTKAEVVALLADKVDIIAGKSLSTNDFTNPYKDKIDNVEAEATKNSTDATLLARANHTGEQAISTVTDLSTTIDGILADILGLENGVNITYKNISLVTDALYQMTDRDHTIIGSDTFGLGQEVVLPDADINNGRIVVVKKADDSGSVLTVQPFDYQESQSTSTDTQLIESQLSFVLTEFGEAVTLQAKSGRWYIIAHTRVKTYVKVITLPIVGKGVGASKSTTAIIGNSIIEEFTIGDELFFTNNLGDYVSGDLSVNIDFLPTGAEVGKECQWRLTYLLNDLGDVENATTATLDSGDQALSAVQYTSQRYTFVLPAAQVKSHLHMKLTRIAIDTGVEPTAEPAVILANISYKADLNQ